MSRYTFPDFTAVFTRFTQETIRAVETFDRLAVLLRSEPIAGPCPTVAPNPHPVSPLDD